jgi:ADP-ribosylation factor GTPase-activating protein 2/3
MVKILKNLLEKDAYNKFCVECNEKDSTHASITYGIFICEGCAELHLSKLGMDSSYIKPIFGDLWDNY